MTATNAHTEVPADDTTQAQFLAPRTHQTAVEGEVDSMRKASAGSAYQVQFADEAVGALVLRRVAGAETEAVCLMGFSGKRAKPDFHFRFRTMERAESYQVQWHLALVQKAKAKVKRKAEKAAELAKPHSLVVGDVLVASWGYDQTNYDYYQVTRLVGARSVEIRELAQLVEGTHWLQGDCVPAKNQFTGEPMVKRVNAQGTVKVRDWGVWAYRKTSVVVGGVEVFAPNHFTAYA
jgi:hypothetical protein